MKKIDLIVPCYNTHKTLYRLFGSIMSQNCRDEIHVILVDDCSDETYDEIIKPFKDILDIEIVRLDKNSGPGTARRVGMQAGKSKYIMFMDSDDTFFNAFSVERLLYEIEARQCEIVYSNFLEDLDNNKFLMHENDHIWVFGKIFKRQYLENFSIYFNDTRSNEDNGFNTLTRCFAEPQYVNETTYIWHHNPNSITRINNGLYTFTCMEGQIENKIWAFTEGYKRGWKREFYIKNIIGQFCYYYFNYFNVKSQTREEIKPELYIQWVKRYYEQFKDEIDEAISQGLLQEAYKSNFISYYNNFDNIFIQDVTINEFIDLLKK